MRAKPCLLERLTASDVFMLLWDRDGCPDLEVIVLGVRNTLADLATAAAQIGKRDDASAA